MRRRVRRDQTGDDPAIAMFTVADDDSFEHNFFGEVLFRTQSEARRAWPRCRRAVWAATPRMRLPDAARVFDALTFRAHDTLLSTWNHIVFPLSDVLAALEADRASVLAFECRDPRAATQIATFLEAFRTDLDLLESQARALARPSCDRLYPPKGWPGGTYGGDQPVDAW
jgi:hypothetical protein